MQTSNKTILISGGGSGIGYETAKRFVQEGNTVIIIGRNEEKLRLAAQSLGTAHYFACDVTNVEQVNALVKKISEQFGKLDILVNNAGQAYSYKLSAEANALEKAQAEITTNYLSLVNVTEQFLPLLQESKEAAIVNVSSIVAFAPSLILPTYSASKAALHSYTQTLRLVLSNPGTIKVFEVMPPLVDTEFAKDISSPNKIPASVVANSILEGIASNTYEIKMGNTLQIYDLFRQSPEKALYALNGIES